MKNRIIGFILCMTLGISAVVGYTACKSIRNMNNEPQTVVLRLALREGTYANVVQDSLEEFEAEHNVKCELLELSEEELRKTVEESADNPGSVDLCMVDGSWVTEFTDDDLLLNLSEAGYALNSDIIPATTDISYKDGDVYVAPYFGNVTVLLFNKKILSHAGYEKGDIHSFEDVLTICKNAEENGIIGFLYRGDTNNNLVVDFLPVLLAYGGWVVDEENQPTVNTREFKDAMSFYLELINTGKATTKDDIVNAITGGHGAMAIAWPGWYTPGDDSTADYCSIEGRAQNGSEVYNANIYGIWGLAVSAQSSNKELSIDLLEYLMSREVQLDSVDVGGVPCRYSCLNNQNVLQKYPEYKDVCTALEKGVYRPMTSNWSDFMDILAPHMSDIIYGKDTMEHGLETAQTELEVLMGE